MKQGLAHYARFKADPFHPMTQFVQAPGDLINLTGQ